MNYAEFKTYLTTFLWKQFDLDLVNNLDSLINMANHELNRSLSINRRHSYAELETTSNTVPLPGDFRQVMSLNLLRPYSFSLLSQVQSSEVIAARMRYPDLVNACASAMYAIEGRTLLLVPTFSEEVRGLFRLQYRNNVPDFRVTDTSWVADDYLDLYVYTVLSHTAPFLREDERVQLWAALKQQALASAIDEDRHHVSFGGSPLYMKPHHYVP